MQETQVQPLGWEDPPEKGTATLGREDPLEMGMAPYSSVVTWRIPWTSASSEAVFSPLFIFRIILSF